MWFVVFVFDPKINEIFLTDLIFETGAYGAPSK
jgi:hypothetical protein